MSTLTECEVYYDISDASGDWTRSTTVTTEASSKCSADSSMLANAYRQMPPDLPEAYDYSDHPYYFHTSASAQFTSGQGPPWSSALPDEVQTYLVTSMLGANEDTLHWNGWRYENYHGLASTSVEGRITTVDITTSIPVSRIVSCMSVLSEAFPSHVNDLLESSRTSAAATAIYSEFTSGITPPWYSALPADVKTFLILDFIPKYRRDRVMTLGVLDETTTALGTSASPGSVPTSGPTSTTTLWSSLTAYESSESRNSGLGPNRAAAIAGIAVSSAVVLALMLLGLLIWLRRRRRFQNYNATPLFSTELEADAPDMRDRLPVQTEQFHETMPAELPEVDMSPTFGELKVLKRRSRSATDLRGWTSWPGIGHEEVPDLPPRSASAMSVRIVRPDE